MNSAPVDVLTHPLVQRDLSVLRARDTSPEAFRHAIRRIARNLAIRVLADVRTRKVEIETPMESTTGVEIAEPVVLVPILRAGLGLVDGFLDMLPEAKVCHLGLARDEHTLQPTCYLDKLDALTGDERVFVLDPMLATGGSALAAVDKVIGRGLDRPPIFVCVLASPEGLKKLHDRHPEVPVLTTVIDRCCDARGWIRPGLGDAGDRLFNC
ncbi:MAG: uracil phosphoribosyltransferase [Nannocystaceae bacterium]|nr:uracil phosphoribosyltransferase [Myxococcales bacterium]